MGRERTDRKLRKKPEAADRPGSGSFLFIPEGKKNERDMKKQTGKLLTAVLIIMTALILGGLCWNTFSLQRGLNQTVAQYVADNNRQLADHISFRIRAGREFVTDLADTLGRMPGFLLTQDLLSRKAAAMELEGIAVVSETGGVKMAFGNTSSLERWLQEEGEIWEKPLVSYVKDQNILFSAPYASEEGSRTAVVGIQEYQDIQDLVKRADHQKNEISILLDTGTDEWMMLEKGADILMPDEQIRTLLAQLPGPGEERHVNIGGNFVAADPVEGTKWLQITVIPFDFLTRRAGKYADIYFLLILTALAVFGASLFLIVRAAARKEQMLLTDSLTGGCNRDGFLKLCGEYVNRRNQAGYSVACLNVSDFRRINSYWGEEEGNRILQIIYHTFSEDMGEGEAVCRSGMDHFVLLLKEKTDEAITLRIRSATERINEVIRRRYLDTIEFAIGVCRIAVAGNPSKAISSAIFVGKQKAGGNVCAFYDEGIASKLSLEKELEESFDASIQNRDFFICLQPKVASRRQEPCQAEALVRWLHPQRGVIGPDQFIPLLERNGKIGELDLYVFEEVCRLSAEWIRRGKSVTEISVNISRFHLKNGGTQIWKKYGQIKEKYRIPDGMIELELTETILIDTSQVGFVKEILNGFRSCGLKVALDDFGFAYSSLTMLKEFEVDTIKLDRSFFLNESKRSRKVVANVIRLAHSLDMCVVAEGIEEEEQVEALREMRCDRIQGYVYSRPIPVEEFEVWRDEHEK